MLSLCLALSPEALQCLVQPPDDSQCVATETRPQLAIESSDLVGIMLQKDSKPTEYYGWAICKTYFTDNRLTKYPTIQLYRLLKPHPRRRQHCRQTM